MSSRKGVEILDFCEIKNEIKMLYSNSLCNSGIIFDGELYTKSLNFESISGIVRQVGCNTELTSLVEYHIYDVYDPKNPSWTFIERNDFINKISSGGVFTKIKIVESMKAHNMKEIDNFHNQFINEGYEGIMIRQIDGQYEENRRSKYLQKFKMFMEEEFEIINFHDGEGHDKNMVIWECKTGTGKLFSVKPKGTFEERRIMFTEAETHIGHFLTVIFQEYSADGIPRFPVGKTIRDMSF
jgi:ATP-dependent DNA ligase